MAPRKRFGALLIENGVIDEHQLNSALGHQKQWGGKLGSVLVQKGLCKEADVVRVLSAHLGMPVIHLGEAQIDQRALKMVSRQIAEKLRVFPIELQGAGRSEVLTIAMAEPTDLSIIDQLSFHTGKRIKPLLTGESEIATAIALYYSDAPQGAAAKPAPVSGRYGAGGANAAGRAGPQSISQRPPPPAIAPPVMAPLARSDAALSTAPFGGPRPTSGRFQPLAPTLQPPAPQPRGPISRELPSPSPVRATPAPIAPAPYNSIPQRPPAPLDEIEPVDFDSIPGLPKAPESAGDRLPGLEPIAAAIAPEPTGWDDAPGDERAPLRWDEPRDGETPDALGEAALPSVQAAPEELPTWSDVELSEPPPATEAAPREPDAAFGKARDWSLARTLEGTPRPEELSDELPQDAILGTAEQLRDTSPGHPPEHVRPAPPASASPAAVASDDGRAATESDRAPAPQEAPATASAPREADAFFETPAEPQAFFAAPLSVESAAPAAVETAAPAHVAAPAPIDDPWADLDIDTDDDDASAAAGALAPAGGEGDPAGSSAAPQASADPRDHDALRAAEHADLERALADAEAARAGRAPENAGLRTAPEALVSEPGAILAPDAWGDVADPLAAPAGPPASEERPHGSAIAGSEVAPHRGDLPASSPGEGSPDFREAPNDSGHEPLAPLEHAQVSAASPEPAQPELAHGSPEQAPDLRVDSAETSAAQPQAGDAAPSSQLHAVEAAPREDEAAPEAAHEPAASEPSLDGAPAPATPSELPEAFASTDVVFVADEFAPDAPAPLHAEEPEAAQPVAEPSEAPGEASAALTPPSADEPRLAEQSADAAPAPETAPAEPASEPAAAEPAPQGAGWLGQELGASTPLSPYDVETLAGVGIDVADGLGAMRLLAALLRALASRQLIDLGELTVDLYNERTAGVQAQEAADAPEERVAGAHDA